MSDRSPRRLVVRAAAGILALALAGGVALQACGSNGSSSSTATTADATTTTVVNTTSLDQVTVTGDLGHEAHGHVRPVVRRHRRTRSR